MKKFSSKLILFSAIIIGLCLINSCKKTSSIIVCIGTLPSTASAGAPVTFTSCTSGASSYTWAFGDGNTATGDTVTHTYATAGTYTGSLTVTSGGSSSKGNFTITVVNNSWTFKGGTYVADSVSTSGGIVLSASGTSGGNKAILDLLFLSLPTSNGNYTVVNAANNNVGAGQVAVILYSFNPSNVETIYGSTGSGTISAAVTVSNGKISATLPTIEVVNQSNASDSTSFAGTITQTQ